MIATPNFVEKVVTLFYKDSAHLMTTHCEYFSPVLY